MDTTFEKIEVCEKNINMIVSMLKRAKGTQKDAYCYKDGNIVVHLYVDDKDRPGIRLDLPLFGKVETCVKEKTRTRVVLTGANIAKSGDKYYINPEFVLPPPPKPSAEIICRI